jgi:aspartate aminotransferase
MSVPSRIDNYRAAVPFDAWYASSRHRSRAGEPGIADLLFGNPHDMPIPGYVAALRKHVEPLDREWFAYKFSEPPAVAVVVDSLRAHTGLPWRPADVAMTNGGWAALAVAIRALTEPGDEVIYFDPPWFFYEMLVRAAEAVPVALRLDAPAFSPDPARLAAALTPRTRVVLVNTPHNPSGRILDAGELSSIAAVLEEASARFGRPIFLLSDEAYRKIVFDGRRAASPSEHYSHTLVAYSFGKQLLAPGQRIGYLAISPRIPDPEPLREAVRLTQFAESFAFPNALLQHALPDIEPLCTDIAALERRRDRLVPELRKVGYEATNPEGTFYVLVRSPIEDDLAFTAALAERDVYILPGALVALPGWFRISLTASDEMIEMAIPRLAEAHSGARAEARAV